MRNVLTVLVLLASVLVSSTGAHARAPLVPQNGASAPPKPAYVLSAGLGGGRYAEDGVAEFRPGFHLRLPQARVGKNGQFFGRSSVAPFALDIEAPMRLTVVDRGIDDGAWRSTEYDQASEFLSILRRVEYGHLHGPLYLRLGALADVRLGHGTALDRFTSNLLVDHGRWGAHLAVQSARAGAQLMIDDVTRPGLFGARVYYAPWAKGTKASSGLAFGLSFVADVAAPLDLVARPTGGVDFDRQRYPEVARTVTTGIVGFDAEYAAVQTENVRMTLYSDVNVFVRDLAAGWHTGVFLGWQTGERSVLSMNAEFRLSGRGYVPNYFSRLYEVARVRVPSPSLAAPVTLAQLRDDVLGDGIRAGYGATLRLDHKAVGSLEFGIDGGGGRFDESVYLRVTTPEDRAVRLALRYELPWLESWKHVQLFEQASLEAEMQISVTDWLVLWGAGGRRWRQTVGNDLRPQTDVRAGATFYYAFPP